MKVEHGRDAARENVHLQRVVEEGVRVLLVDPADPLVLLSLSIALLLLRHLQHLGELRLPEREREGGSRAVSWARTSGRDPKAGEPECTHSFSRRFLDPSSSALRLSRMAFCMSSSSLLRVGLRRATSVGRLLRVGHHEGSVSDTPTHVDTSRCPPITSREPVEE